MSIINFNARRNVWHKMGVNVTSNTSEGALKEAGLDWDVEKRELFLGDGSQVENCMATVRTDTNQVLGVVSPKYTVVQNHEAFSFLDVLVGNQGYTIDRAGMFGNSGSMWVLVKSDDGSLLGDPVGKYMIFVNSHDGTSALKVMMTPVRIACSNMLNYALKSASRKMSFSHIGDVKERFTIAAEADQLMRDYMKQLELETMRLESKEFNSLQVKKALSTMFPVESGDGTRKINSMKESRDAIAEIYLNAPDLTHMGKSANRFLYAVSDFATHKKAKKETETYAVNLFKENINGNALIDMAYNIVREAA